jgi:hypothetical protein
VAAASLKLIGRKPGTDPTMLFAPTLRSVACAWWKPGPVVSVRSLHECQDGAGGSWVHG